MHIDTREYIFDLKYEKHIDDILYIFWFAIETDLFFYLPYVALGIIHVDN